MPGDLNNSTVYAAGVGTKTKEADAVKALIKLLHSPEAAAVFKARGLNPA